MRFGGYSYDGTVVLLSRITSEGPRMSNTDLETAVKQSPAPVMFKTDTTSSPGHGVSAHPVSSENITKMNSVIAEAKAEGLIHPPTGTMASDSGADIKFVASAEDKNIVSSTPTDSTSALITGMMDARKNEVIWGAVASGVSSIAQVTAAWVLSYYNWKIQEKWADTKYSIATLQDQTTQLALSYDMQFKTQALSSQMEVAKESIKYQDKSDRRNFIVKLVAIQAKKEYLLNNVRANRTYYELGNPSMS
ncbi:hypothetical protein KKA47_01470 [bacterium]|nr:hypothetical protein [bacterium]